MSGAFTGNARSASANANLYEAVFRPKRTTALQQASALGDAAMNSVAPDTTEFYRHWRVRSMPSQGTAVIIAMMLVKATTP